MNRKVPDLLIIVLNLILFSASSVCFAENPIIQTKFTADPAPMVHNDTVFLYTGHDEDDATGFKMLNWMLYTSTDMVNWRDHGVVASLENFKWAGNNGAWAAQCIYRNGKFYFYCTVQLKGIGVLVADSPYGPFTDPIGRPLINNSIADIDPSPFIDDDGQAYLYWGNPDCYYVKLNNDMISYSGSIVKFPKIQTFQEGPWAYKRNNIYYMAFASTCCPEGIGYATSSSPTGPWTYKGSIMDGNPGSSGNHPGIIDYKGKTYCFGFNYAINFSETTVHRERRSVCVAEITFKEDGTIPKLPWWGGGMPSSAGVEQVGSLNPYDTVQAETICWSQGVETEACTEGGLNVGFIENGDFIKVKGVDFGTGATSFDARVASNTNGGKIELHLDSLTGTLAGTCDVTGTGGWQNWVTSTCEVSGATGKRDLFLKFTGESGFLFNFNWWKFNQPTAAGETERKGLTNKNTINVSDIFIRDRALHLSFSGQPPHDRLNVCLYGMNGQLMMNLFQGYPSAQHLTVPLNNQIKPGIYILKVISGEKLFSTRVNLIQ